jgi:hypothetical protein
LIPLDPLDTSGFWIHPDILDKLDALVTLFTLDALDVDILYTLDALLFCNFYRGFVPKNKEDLKVFLFLSALPFEVPQAAIPLP